MNTRDELLEIKANLECAAQTVGRIAEAGKTVKGTFYATDQSNATNKSHAADKSYATGKSHFYGKGNGPASAYVDPNTATQLAITRDYISLALKRIDELQCQRYNDSGIY